MTDKPVQEDKTTWAIPGGLMMGLGVGFFFLKASALYFVGCLIGGLGLGLFTAAILGSRNKK
jgi:hypothetical protein